MCLGNNLEVMHSGGSNILKHNESGVLDSKTSFSHVEVATKTARRTSHTILKPFFSETLQNLQDASWPLTSSWVGCVRDFQLKVHQENITAMCWSSNQSQLLYSVSCVSVGLESPVSPCGHRESKSQGFARSRIRVLHHRISTDHHHLHHHEIVPGPAPCQHHPSSQIIIRKAASRTFPFRRRHRPVNLTMANARI